MAKNVLLGDNHFSDLATEKLFFQGEESIICEGLSFSICSQLVGLSGGIGFLGVLQNTCTFWGFNKIFQNWGEISCILCQPEDFTYGSHVGLNEADRVLVDAHVVRILNF